MSSERQIATALVGKQRFEKLTMNGASGFSTRFTSLKTSIGFLQILYGDGAHRAVEVIILQRQHRLAIEVLHKPARQPRIGRQLLGVHAMADELAVIDIGRQMADPARHQIEQARHRRAVRGGRTRRARRLHFHRYA